MKDACFWALVTSAIDRSVRRPVAGSTNGVVARDFMPSRTAMSTTSGTPVNSSSLMNAVFGDVASASVTDIFSGSDASLSALLTGIGRPLPST